MEARQSGFSLLESIVALTVLATSGVALFGWFSVSYDGLIRVQEIQDRHELMDDLRVYFSTLNVQEETTQRMQVNGFDIVWTSGLVEPKQVGRSGVGSDSNFDLGLYDINIEIYRDDRLLGEYETRLVGYTRVRNIADES